MLIIPEPTKLVLPEDANESILKTALAYVDQKAVYEYNKAKNSSFLRYKMGDDFYPYLEDLKASRNKSLLMGTEGSRWTYSGLSRRMGNLLKLPIENQVLYPDAKFVPWDREPDKKPRPYQLEAEELLLEARHASVQMGTGLGKSFIILRLAKRLGLKTVVMTPSVSIAEQILAEFTRAFGKKYVGAFFDGTKQAKKLFVVGVAASLARIKEDSPEFEELSKAKVFIADESHMTPANTLASVCFKLVASAPYRFFFSGTQMRNDGLDLMLEGIIGPIVYEMTVRQGVDQGYLAKPLFRMVNLLSDSSFDSKDSNEMTREHLLYNPRVNKYAAQLANMAYGKSGHQVLILIDEIEQFAHLLPHLKHRVGFAHSGNKDSLAKIPKEYHDPDNTALVAEFNAKKLPILVGTSAISTGTDIRSNKTTIYLMGGKSEIQVRQAVGRDTRLEEGKTDCYHFDFDIENIPSVHRHAEMRRDIYNDIYGPVVEVNRM